MLWEANCRDNVMIYSQIWEGLPVELSLIVPAKAGETLVELKAHLKEHKIPIKRL